MGKKKSDKKNSEEGDTSSVSKSLSTSSEEVPYMHLRNRTVKTSRKQKNDSPTVEEEENHVAEEEEEEEVNAWNPSNGDAQPFMRLRSGKVMTPASNKRRKRKNENPVEEAEEAVMTILERRSIADHPEIEQQTPNKDKEEIAVDKNTKKNKNKTKKVKKTDSHCFLDCFTTTCFVIFGLLGIASGAYAFFVVKGEPIMLKNVFNFYKPASKTAERFDNYLESLGGRLQVLIASSIFFVSCCICGLCWMAHYVVRANNSGIDPVYQLEKLLSWRRKILANRKEICDKLDSGNQTSEDRVEYLKRLQICDTQLSACEDKITLIWVEYGDEVLASM